MRKFSSIVPIAVAAIGCASAQKPVAPLVAATVPPTALESRPAPSPAPIVEKTPSRHQDLSVAYGLARAEEWVDLDVGSATRMRSWTPDAFIGNRVTRAKIAFASVPAVLGTTSQVAEGIRAQMDGKAVQADVVIADVSGKRAAFTFASPKDGTKGKIVVTRVPGLDSQYVLLVGEWPADADSTSLSDIDAIALSIKASPAP